MLRPVFAFVAGMGACAGLIALWPKDTNRLGAALEFTTDKGNVTFRIPTTCQAVVYAHGRVDEDFTLYLPQPSCEGALVLSNEPGLYVGYPKELEN